MRSIVLPEVMMSEKKGPIPEGIHLRKFFGDHFDVIRRVAGERSEELVQLVENRRSKQRCDLCGLPVSQPSVSSKPFIGAYICDTCRRELQRR
ncbi:MAG: hypothetical protein RBU37_01495 [Myxococcota bacterium]|jgi:hypothetical protein|nr:hypothetical protein [Myxococcota bacterium]